MNLLTLPSQEYLRSIFDYNPKTGIITRRKSGEECFKTISPNGYKRGTLDGCGYASHRIIWKWMTGQEPNLIDHEDGNRTNNRWYNLKNVEIINSNRNRCKPKHNTTGVIGVRQIKSGRYRAYISHEGIKLNLGNYRTLEEAAIARKKAEIELGYHPNHGRDKVLQPNFSSPS